LLPCLLAVEGGIKARLGIQKDGLYLYRNCLPPAVPGLAFVGSEVSTFNNVLTSGLQVGAHAGCMLRVYDCASLGDLQSPASPLLTRGWHRLVQPTVVLARACACLPGGAPFGACVWAAGKASV